MQKTLFLPFENDTQALIFTDSHGNEFNVVNGTDKISVYGQWQGKADSSTAQEIKYVLESIFNKIKSSLGGVEEKKQSGIKVSKKKDEVLIQADLDLLIDELSLNLLSSAFNKIKS